MTNTVEYKNHLFQWIPEGAKQITAFTIQGKQRVEYFTDMRCWIELPKGRWQIIGKADSLTDKDWEGIVEKERNFYRLYNFKYWSDGSTPSPTLSGHTLIKSLGFDSPEEVLILKK